MQYEQGTQGNEESTPYLVAGAVRFHHANEADDAEDRRPKPPQNTGVDNSEAIEKQHNADTSDHQSGNQSSGCCSSITGHVVLPYGGVHSSPPRLLGQEQQDDAQRDQQQRPPCYEVSGKIKAYCEDIQTREQHQGADGGNEDPDDGIARVGLQAVAVHNALLAINAVDHEVQSRRRE